MPRPRRCLRTFQFPLSERTNCNANSARDILRATQPFSFLYRNERTATFGYVVDDDENEILSVSSIGTNELQQPSPIPVIAVQPTFSFLYRNERTATVARLDADAVRRCLSVSSIGTNELQR